jgi:type IV pilus assembly protein PilB
LRAILRQDPDIIYVGEIRDQETAEVAIRAALTGHLVLSTLHSSTAVGSITRLIDIGVAPVLIESAMNCSFAQRLVRKICPRCTQKYIPNEELLKQLNIPSETRCYRGEGCEYCSGSGYKGRVGIFEILVMNREIRSLISARGSEEEITKKARENGMSSLFEDGVQKVNQGITTIEELERVTDEVS